MLGEQPGSRLFPGDRLRRPAAYFGNPVFNLLLPCRIVALFLFERLIEGRDQGIDERGAVSGSELHGLFQELGGLARHEEMLRPSEFSEKPPAIRLPSSPEPAVVLCAGSGARCW